MRAFRSPSFGINFDTASRLRVQDDPVEATEKLVPYVLATHIKDIEPGKGRSVRAGNDHPGVAADWLTFVARDDIDVIDGCVLQALHALRQRFPRMEDTWQPGWPGAVA